MASQHGNNTVTFIEKVQTSQLKYFSVQFVEILQFSSWIWDYLFKKKKKEIIHLKKPKYIINSLTLITPLLTKEDVTIHFVFQIRLYIMFMKTRLVLCTISEADKISPYEVTISVPKQPKFCLKLFFWQPSIHGTFEPDQIKHTESMATGDNVL